MDLGKSCGGILPYDFFLFIFFTKLALIDRFVFDIVKVRKQEAEYKLLGIKRLIMSMVSHEIKTPLAQLQMNLDMLESIIVHPDKLQIHGPKISQRFEHSISSIKKMMHDFIYFMNIYTLICLV